MVVVPDVHWRRGVDVPEPVLAEFQHDAMKTVRRSRLGRGWAPVTAPLGSKGSVPNGMAIHHDHMVEWLNNTLGRHRDLFEVTSFSDPVLSLLALAARIDRPLAAPPRKTTPPRAGPL